MLNELSIKNFAIINDLKMSFQEGFSVLTGETGAGKSIIIEAVNLILGARASADMVRAGCESAELEAFFDVDGDARTAGIMRDQGLDPSEGLMVRRMISTSGKSRIFINARQATLDLLRQVTRDLAGVSSQHAHQGLLSEDNHLEILDAFAGTVGLRDEIRSLYQTLIPMRKKIRELKGSLEQKKKDQDLIAFQLDEIRAAAILPDEDEILERKRQVLSTAARTFETVSRAIHEIHDREGALIEKLTLVANEMERAGETREVPASVARRLSAMVFDLQDMVRELRQFSDGLDLDPQSIEDVDQRRDLIARLKRKYGGSLPALFQTRETFERHEIETAELEDRIRVLENESQNRLADLSDKADHLSELRRRAGASLSSLASEEFRTLEMGRAGFEVAFSTLSAGDDTDVCTARKEKIGPDGKDRVAFLLSPNPGEPLKPLSRIASGGELSRIVLALKAVLSRTRSLETLIFDEVDAGIGGATSEKVGQKLKQLSRNHQIICITHLAQIAKYADSQFRIFKSVADGRTYTTILPLTEKAARIEEIARMIGGSDITPATLSHARELLDQGTA